MQSGKRGLLTMNWAEQIAGILLIVGFVFQLTTIGSSFLSYIIIFLWGMMFGRLWYKLRKTNRFPLFLIMLGFVAGYVLAAMITGYGRPIFLIAAFLCGTIISHLLHKEGMIKGF